MLKRLKKNVKKAYEELINLLIIAQTSPGIEKEVVNMVIGLESKVNNLTVSINEYFDDIEIQNKKENESGEVPLPNDIEIRAC